ncbi:glycosyltransferase family 2 protein [Patescibacteria group bacterium]|nr:glycosyltransferase family 2 protein [Patescibacteria group bacterium]
MTKISVVVSAHNEEKNIVECLKSVAWVDEIILIDSASSDQTVVLAKQFKAKIFRRPNYPMLNKNKNFGFAKASGDWILNLDADERVSSPLKKEILVVVKKNQQPAGYTIPRKNIIFGKWIKHGLWYPDEQLRLFRRSKGKFPEVHVHEKVTVKGSLGQLKNHIVHYNYRTISQFLYKMQYLYVPNEVDNFIKSGKKIYWHDALRFPANDFIKNFFRLQGYKDGLHGLVLCLLQAFYSLLVFCYIWEKQGFWQFEQKNFLSQINIEFKQIKKNLRYWQIKAKAIPEVIKKILLKLNR